MYWGKTCRTRQDSRSPGRDFKQQYSEQKTAKMPQRTGTATPTGRSFNNKMGVERADTRTSTKSLGSLVPPFDLRDWTSVTVLTTLCCFHVALICKSSKSEWFEKIREGWYFIHYTWQLETKLQQYKCYRLSVQWPECTVDKHMSRREQAKKMCSL